MHTHVSLCRKQKGSALLMAIFGMMLLSAAGLGLVFLATTESGISANFGEQQQATYGAIAGLQEGRERLRLNSNTDNVAWPTGLPSASAANIVYIVNPSAGETVAPWDPNNAYADTELCKEFSSLCSNGKPIGGTGWFTCVSNQTSGSVVSPCTNSSSTAWGRSVPLNTKWVRITRKADNTIPGVPTRASANGTVVCWTGSSQVPVPAGHGNDCSPNGSLVAITPVNNGSGYKVAPTVTISAPDVAGGTQATAVAVLGTPSGQISSYKITSGGSYSSAPTVTFVGGGATRSAVATAILGGRSVASLSYSASGNGSCYTGASGPNISFTAAVGSGAAAKPVMTSGRNCVATWVPSVSGACTGLANTTQSVTTSNFEGQISFNASGYISGYSITNPGTGISSTPKKRDISGPSGCSISYTWGLGYSMTGVTLTNGGGAYSTAPTVSVAPSPTSGSSPTITATLSSTSSGSGAISGLSFSDYGAGYTSAPAVVFSGSGGAAATVTVDTTAPIQAVNITNAGSGYLTAPTVTITPASGDTGSGAYFTASLGDQTYYGPVAVVTSMSQTTPVLSSRKGALAMAQMEVAVPPRSPYSLQLGGAITLAGPNPIFGAPNSMPYKVIGSDGNSCGKTATPSKPAIGVTDGTAANLALNLPKQNNYPGQLPSPDVENVSSTLCGVQTVNAGDACTGTTPSELESFLQMAKSETDVANRYSGSTTSLTNMGTASNPVTNFVDGDLTLSGNFTGYGILIVTGNLVMKGNYTWNGLILVIGKGNADLEGGGNGQVNGAVWVAKTRDSSGNTLSTLGSPTLNNNGGGGNGVQYDHCYADDYLGTLPSAAPDTWTKPLVVLSTKTITN